MTCEFVRDGSAHGAPSFTRVELDIMVRRVPEFGWFVVQAAGEISSRPFDGPGSGDLPPEDVWVGRKGAKAYAYDLRRS